ncbi:MAG: hypothetical protein GXO76_13845 [Calditrichaeota bacterium]|nr:hypothetical protein [Calditrichota bacterium]
MIIPVETRKEILIQETRTYGDAHFDETTGLVAFENGLHPVRDSFWYAFSLFEDGSEDSFNRAETIVRAVLHQQEKRTGHPKRGSFKLWAEDSEPIDPNWADFNACNLAEMLNRYGRQLSPDLVQEALEALELAVENILSRNVFLKYTNMLLLSGEAAILGGELLGEERVVSRGWEKLRSWADYTSLNGSPWEYNSPTYSGVNLLALAAIATYSKHAEIRALAAAAEARHWLHLALHTHPETHQLGGPHSRAYFDDLTFAPSRVGSAIFAVTGNRIFLGVGQSDHDILGRVFYGIASFHCPGSIRQLFLKRSYPFEVKEQIETEFSIPIGESGSMTIDWQTKACRLFPYGDRDYLGFPHVMANTCYQTETYVLGTVTHQDSFYQRRNLLLYYRTKAEETPDNFATVWGNFVFAETDEHPLSRRHYFLSVQDKNRVAVLYTPPSFLSPLPRFEPAIPQDSPVRTARAFLKFTGEVQFFLGDENVQNFPQPVPAESWLFAEHAGHFLAIYPFRPEPEVTGRGIILEKRADEIFLNFYNAKNNPSGMTQEQLQELHNGYLFATGSVEENISFRGFRESIQNEKIETRVSPTERAVKWMYSGGSLELAYDPRDIFHADRRISGRRGLPQLAVSPVSRQAFSGPVTFGGVTFNWTGGVPLTFLFSPEEKTYFILNASSGKTDIFVEIPGQKITLHSFGAGWVTIDSLDPVSISAMVAENLDIELDP